MAGFGDNNTNEGRRGALALRTLYRLFFAGRPGRAEQGHLDFGLKVAKHNCTCLA